MDSLAKQFELEVPTLHQIIAKMIVKNKIQAHFDIDHKLLILETGSNEMKELQ